MLKGIMHRYYAQEKMQTRENTYQFPMAKSSNCTCVFVCGIPHLEYYFYVIVAPNVIQHDYFSLD